MGRASSHTRRTAGPPRTQPELRCSRTGYIRSGAQNDKTFATRARSPSGECLILSSRTTFRFSSSTQTWCSSCPQSMPTHTAASMPSSLFDVPRSCRDASSPLYRRSRRNFPLDVHHGPPIEAQSQIGDVAGKRRRSAMGRPAASRYRETTGAPAGRPHPGALARETEALSMGGRDSHHIQGRPAPRSGDEWGQEEIGPSPACRRRGTACGRGTRGGRGLGSG